MGVTFDYIAMLKSSEKDNVLNNLKIHLVLSLKFSAGLNLWIENQHTVIKIHVFRKTCFIIRYTRSFFQMPNKIWKFSAHIDSYLNILQGFVSIIWLELLCMLLAKTLNMWGLFYLGSQLNTDFSPAEYTVHNRSKMVAALAWLTDDFLMGKQFWEYNIII